MGKCILNILNQAAYTKRNTKEKINIFKMSTSLIIKKMQISQTFFTWLLP